MFVLGLLLAAAYWPGIISPAMSPRWAVLSLVATGLLLWRARAIPFTPAHLAGCAFVVWAALSVLWSPSPLDSIDALWQTVCLPAVCFCLGSQERSLRPLFIGAACGLVLSGAVAIGQVLGWVALPEVWGPSGLFVNRNYMAEAAALVAVFLLGERMWWWAVLILPALILPMARGAVLAVGVAAMAHMWRRSRFWGSLMLVLGCAGAIVVLSIDKGNSAMVERWAIWGSALAQMDWLGHGIGSYWAIHPELYQDGVTEHAHNDFLELASDLGIGGVVLFGWFAWNLRGQLDTARLVLIALAVETCFAFPTHMPVTAALGALCAGFAVRDRPLVCGVAVYRRGTFQEGLV